MIYINYGYKDLNWNYVTQYDRSSSAESYFNSFISIHEPNRCSW